VDKETEEEEGVEQKGLDLIANSELPTGAIRKHERSSSRKHERSSSSHGKIKIPSEQARSTFARKQCGIW
jgi:hypothetical protein